MAADDDTENNGNYDKLQIEANFKLTFPGIEFKELKTSDLIPVTREMTRRRVTFKGGNGDVCAAAVAIDGKDVPSLSGGTFVLIVVKLAKVDANKSAVPIWVGNKTFTGPDPLKSIKLEGDGSVAFWDGQNGRLAIGKDAAQPVWVLNPNRTAVVLDIYYGISEPSKDPTGKGGASSGSSGSQSTAKAIAS